MLRMHTEFAQRLVVTILAASAAAGCAPAPAPPPSSATVFEGARIIVGAGQVIENGTLVMDGGKFTHVGSAGSVEAPAGAARVSLAGKTVMPALVDTHTHLSQTAEALTTDLRQRASFGIGAAMNLGLDTGDVAFQMRAQPPAGVARFFTAGRGITSPEKGRSEVPFWITTEAEARTAVQELAALKVDIVKIWVDDRNGQFKKLSPELYTAVIDEAHSHGLRVTAHIFALEDAKGLLRAGVDAFAHGIRDMDVDEEGIALFKAHPQVVLVPNMPDRGVAVDYSWLSGSVPADMLTKIQEASTDRPAAQASFGIQARNLAALSAAGVRIALGTDGNTFWAPHVEMADMVASGMTPMQVIVAATKTSAEFVGLADTGTIEVGQHADFIVLDANPLDDITNTRRISAVYLRGMAVEPTMAPPSP